jgi:ABC-type transport system substrate-binding protein
MSIRGSDQEALGKRWRQSCGVVAMLFALIALAACDSSPWPAGSAATNTIHSSMTENTPRHLDPTASYWSNDTAVTYQVYEPLYAYHYLKRPYELIPKAAAEVVKPYYLDKQGQRLPDDAPADQIAESVYDVPLKKGVMYQPHPAFAKGPGDAYRYHAMKPGEVGTRTSPMQFEHTGTREMVADDFVYALKRHATTRITAPIFGIFSEYIVGLKDYGELIKQEDAKLRQGLDPSSLDKPFLDFRRWPLAGAQALNPHLLRIRIIGKYPQWKYWMQMTFTAPIPWEADAFYAQPGFAERGISLDQWPVGTGAYMVTEFRKDSNITMVRNPNYHGELYPCEGMPQDKARGLLDDCGKTMPFIDRILLTVEREQTPQKNKFRDGHYDIEVYERTDTGQHFMVEALDSDEVRKVYEARGQVFPTYADVNSYWTGFNMLDPTVGNGDTPAQAAKNRKLRQAINIAVSWDEYSVVFPKKAGVTAMSPLPPGIPGSRDDTPEGINPGTHVLVDGKRVRRSIDDAKRLMVEAGYPEGRDEKTGAPLAINYDVYFPATPERKPEIDWMVKQFAKIDIQLDVRATDNNQFQDKVRNNKHQFFWLGWNADYPDAENFLFLFYGPNAKSVSDGENTQNYINPAYDKLFVKLKSLDDGPEKQKLIDQMVQILRDDAPITMGFYPHASSATQRWVKNAKPAILIRDHGRYLRLDVNDRVQSLAAWNTPTWWPLLLVLGAAAAVVWAALRAMRRRERTNARGEVLSHA